MNEITVPEVKKKTASENLINAADIIYKAKKQIEDQNTGNEILIKELREMVEAFKLSTQEYRVLYEQTKTDLYMANVRANNATTFAIIGVLFGCVCLGFLFLP